MTDAWLDSFPQLRGLDAKAFELLRRSSMTAELPSGAVAFSSGQACENYLFVTDGTVRVQLTADSGREILLYRVGPGETCVLTTTALMSDDSYMAEGVAETPVRAIALPAPVFRRLMAESEPFRRFVFSTFSLRITALMQVIQGVAFGHIGPRLAAALLARGEGRKEVEATHQDLAVELGTAREVVSRQLKDFERRGWVRLGRGRIELSDRPALRGTAESPAWE